jgi:hypothetical protein
VPAPVPVAQPAPATPAAAAKPAAPAAPAKPAAAQAKPAKPAQPGGRGVLKWALVGGAAVLVLVGVIAAVMLTPLGGPRSQPAGATPAEAPAATPNAATPAAGTPVEAPAAPPVEPPPAASVPVTPPVAPPPPVQPRSETPPVARPAATPQRTQPIGRSGAATPAVAPKPKGPNLALAFEEARAAIDRGDYPTAIAGLESILSVDPGYPKAADLLDVARSSVKNAAKTAVDAGAKAEADRDNAEAERQYQRALQADPQSTAAQDGLRRVKARLVSEGEDAFKRARQYDAIGRVQEAISMYEKAIQLLPSDHASVKIARERLAALKSGVE